MTKALYILLLFLTLAPTAAAQSDFDEPKWTRFAPEREEFSLDFPSPSVIAIGRVSADVKHAEYHVVQNKTYFTVFSEDDAETSVLRQLMGLVITDAAPKDIEIDGIKGRRYDFKGADDYEHSLIAIQAPAHFYIFHAISETSGDPVSEQFLASIKLDRQMPAEEKTPGTSAAVSSAGRSDILKDPVAGGLRIPGGVGPPVENGIAPPKHTRIDSAVTILVKPAASYTTLARRYMISGTVRLRVTFEKDGEVGNVSVLAKLPLGLTQSAISAARQIKFSPELRNGDPYAATKVVEYSFNIK